MSPRSSTSTLRPGLAALLALAATGCATAPARKPEATFSSEPTAQRLVILHASDTESELLPEGKSAGIARFAAVLSALRAQDPAHTVVLGAGDTFMPAPALQVELDGRNAVAVANGAIGLQASSLGNHEFDRGESFLAEMVAQAPFPYLTATVDFRGGPLDKLDFEEEELAKGSPWLAQHPGRILPRGKLCVGGEIRDNVCTGFTLGVVGATTEELRMVASSQVKVGIASDFTELRNRIQRHVDALRAEGITTVVLLSHLQDVRRELELVDAGITGVDVIISGGGDDRLADPADRLLPGDEPHPLCPGEASCYPLVRRAADGKPVLILATDGQYRYVGRLALGFDANGVITSIDPESRPWPVDDNSLAVLHAKPAPELAALEADVATALEPAQRPVAPSRVFFEGEREAVRNRETNLGDLSADALAWSARVRGHEVAFGLRNGGGIRASIGVVDRRTGERRGGPISAFDVDAAFRFDNPIVVVETTRKTLVETLEASLRGAGTGRGHFPQVSGDVVLVYDPAAPEQEQKIVGGDVVGVDRPGSRLRTLRIGDETLVENGVIQQPDAKISFATLDYLARGGDGWFPGSARALSIHPVGIREQKALLGYLKYLQRQGTWKGGAAYLDPIPEMPETFERIRVETADNQ